MSKALTRVLDRRYKVNKEIERILRQDYPPGTRIRWERNGIHRGEVVMNCYSDQVKVRNARTGREYCIYAYCILGRC